MSGNAALSAARKRRASSTPVGGGGSSTQFSAYYNRTTPTTQQLMNQTFPEHNSKQPQSQYTLPRESAPNVPINIYENIELIKQQIAARTTLIQTQGSAIPPEKLRVLQKQNEIQNQILIQKMAIAKQMEQAEQRQLQEQEQMQQQQMLKMAIPSMDEPEFIYEKGIPRKNPKYKTPAEIEAIRQAQAQARAQARALAPAQPVFQQQKQQQQQQQPNNQGPVRMTPFVSMITETGVIPPPIVILKSHDAKLKEHDDVIQEMAQQMDYLLERVSSNGSLPVIREETSATSNDTTENTENADDEPEQELLMDVVINDLTNSREFVEGIVDKIVNETNLSEVIMKIEPLVKENQELRSLIHSQQQMMNEMNTMLLRLLNTNGTVVSSSQVTDLDKSQEVFKDDGLDVDGLYQPEITEIVLSNTGQVEIEFHQEDSEPAQIIDTEEENDEPDNSPTNDTVADAAAADAAAADAEDEPDNSPTTDATEDDAEADDGTTKEAEAEADADADAAYDLSSDKPHFPIALIVNEI
jgi:hypothetical protein